MEGKAGMGCGARSRFCGYREPLKVFTRGSSKRLHLEVSPWLPCGGGRRLREEGGQEEATEKPQLGPEGGAGVRQA